MNKFFRKFLSGWDAKPIIDDKIKKGSILSPSVESIDQKILKEYVDIYLTLHDFKDSYPDVNIDNLSKYPHKIDLIGFEKNIGTYSLFLECNIKKEYNVQVLFREYCLEFNNPKLKSIIRDNKLNQII